MEINVYSLRTDQKLDNIKEILSNYRCSVDVLVLTGVWVYENEIANFSIDNFKIYSATRDVSRSGGVLIHVSNKYDSILLERKCGINIEILVVRIESLNLNIIAYYRSSNSSFYDFFDMHTV